VFLKIQTFWGVTPFSIGKLQVPSNRQDKHARIRDSSTLFFSVNSARIDSKVYYAFCGANEMRTTTGISGCHSERFPQYSRGTGGSMGEGWELFSS
jgi:hypothetical protein